MAVWVRACRANYEWAVELALALAAEYSKRFGQKTHKCEYNALWLWYHVPPLPDPSQTPTVPPFCAGQYAKDYADSTASHMDIVTAYRRYYTDEKLQLVLYRHSRVPYFIERYLRKQKRSVEFLRRQISRKKRQRTA